MSLKTKTLNFNGNTITFAKIDGIWSIPAKLLGLALGYANDGQKLADAISGSWSAKWNNPLDYKVLNGPEVTALRKATPGFGVAPTVPSILLLSMTGVIKVLLKSRSKMADQFRDFLSANGGELVDGLQVSVAKKAQLSLPLNAPSGARQSSLDELMATLERGLSMKAMSKAEVSVIFKAIAEMQFKKVTSELNQIETAKTMQAISTMVSPAKKDATQMVPVSNIQASSMTPNFDSVASFFLTGHQKHPKYTDWIPAEEIGTEFGLTSDQVKKYTTQYAELKGVELSNVIAMQKVKNAGGYFRGVASLVDDHKLPCYVDLELGCAGIWYLMEDGKLVWRNYWSPEAVKAIKARITAARPFQVKNQPKQAELPAAQQTLDSPKAWEGSSTLAHPELVQTTPVTRE